MRASPKLLVISVGTDVAASSRVRMAPLIREAEASGWQTRRITATDRRWFISAVVDLLLWRPHVLVLQKLTPGRVARTTLRLMSRKMVYDLDDAIYLGYPGKEALADRNRESVHGVARVADRVVVSNDLIAQDLATWGLPTPRVFAGPSPKAADGSDATRSQALWLGSPSTVHNVRSIYGQLRSGLELPMVVLGAPADVVDDGISELVWTFERQERALSEALVGLFPLVSTPWADRTAGYKILEYLAHDVVPVVSDAPFVHTLLGDQLERLGVVVTGDWPDAIDAARDIVVDDGWRAARDHVFERWSPTQYSALVLGVVSS